MRRLLCILLILIGLCPLHAQEQAEVDSLYRVVESLPRGAERLNQLAKLVRIAQLMPEGIKYSRQLYTEAMQQHNDTDNAVSCAENQTVQRHKYKAKADSDGDFEQINQNMPPFFLCGFALADYLLGTRLIEL